MTAVEALKQWFGKLSEEQQRSVIEFLYRDTVVRYGRYCGPAPSIIQAKGGLYSGPAPTAEQMTADPCPTCGKPR